MACMFRRLRGYLLLMQVPHFPSGTIIPPLTCLSIIPFPNTYYLDAPFPHVSQAPLSILSFPANASPREDVSLNSVLTVDVPITVNIPCSNKVLQKASITRTCNVLGWNFHWTEFIEFIVFDVLVRDKEFTSISGMRGRDMSRE